MEVKNMWVTKPLFWIGAISGAAAILILQSRTTAQADAPASNVEPHPVIAAGHELFVEQALMSAREFAKTEHANLHGLLYCAPLGRYVGHCSIQHDDGAITLLLCDEKSCMIEGRVR